MKVRSMKSTIILFLLCCSVVLAGGSLVGCGQDGATGAAGPAGAPGGTSAIAKLETCVICHGINRDVADVSVVHMTPVVAEPVIVTSSSATTVPVVNYSNQSPATLASLTMSVTGTPLIDTTVSKPVITFRVVDASNRPVIGLSTSQVSMNILKLVPGTAGSPDMWEGYITGVSSKTGLVSTTPTLKSDGTLADIGDGTYRYTFKDNTVSGTTGTWNVAFDPTLTHRLGIHIVTSGGPHKPVNYWFDFVPDGSPVTTRRVISNVAYCMECHGMNGAWTKGTNPGFHGGNRIDPNTCVFCHTYQRANSNTAVASVPTATGLFTNTSQAIVTGQVTSGLYTRLTLSGAATPAFGDGLAQLELVTYVHKLHRGRDLTLQNYNVGGVPMNEITYPQDLRNCRKCHKGDTAAQLALTPQGNNWKTKPSQKACGSCHDSISWQAAPGTGMTAHPVAGAQADDSGCSTVGCHSPADIEDQHMTENYTPNNPAVPTGLTNFTYEISSATVTNSTQPVVKFRIKSAPSATTIGTPVSLVCNTSSSRSDDKLLVGYSGSPAIMMAYALPQGTVTSPADYNNLGKAAGQPASVYISDICNGTSGTMTGPDGSGFYTATVTAATASFPAGSSLRTVALERYFTQNISTGISATTSRHAISTFKTVSGDTARRSIIDNAKCANCHEWFEGHGGSRVYTYEVCVMCHIPNLTSSGRAAAPATVLARLDIADAEQGNPAGTSAAKLTADGYDPADPSTFPEETMNMKNLIHGIHSAGKRASDESPDFRFVRDRGTSGVFYYNMKEVTFPGVLNKCETCHKTGTAGGYDIELPAGVLDTTVAIDDEDPITTVATSRTTVPNEADAVTSPIASVCRGCHANSMQRTHMEYNGASIGVPRGTAVSGSTPAP